MASPADTDHVHNLLAQHGLRVSDDELAQLAETYRANRHLIESLYTMPGVRYEEPALTFDPRR